MPSLTLTEARARAAQLSDVSYDVELDLTGTSTGTASYGSRVTIRFASSGPETFLELHRGQDVSVTLNGEAVEAAYDGHRIALTGLDRRNEVVVDARMPYVTDGEGMHTFTDPADGERYVGAYVGIDITQRVFACLDQVDLKAPIALRVVADPAWTVLSNARVASRRQSTQADAWEFTPTPPIPIDLFVLCAGPWHSRTFEHAGLPMGWHARRSLADELDRDFDELRRVTEQCFDHYVGIFDEPFPFDTYDQVFVPGLNWGAMENPGCVTYRDEMLPRGPVLEEERRLRAMVIAHEMSHMWFGDLVSQTWWEDIWLNESFADYMGFEVAQEAAGFAGTRISFESRYKPGAYVADRRRSTHPVAPLAEEVPDVDAATNNFDAISYAKGNAAIRQLVTWLGTEEFLAGVNNHLTRHRFANATLADLIGALDAVSPRDVRGWAELWLRTSGHDTIRVRRDGDVPVLVREGVRPHRLRVTAYDDAMGEVGDRWVDLADDPVPLAEWAGRVVVPNSLGRDLRSRGARRAVVGGGHRAPDGRRRPAGPRPALDRLLRAAPRRPAAGRRASPRLGTAPHAGPGSHRPRHPTGAPGAGARGPGGRASSTGWPRRTAPGSPPTPTNSAAWPWRVAWPPARGTPPSWAAGSTPTATTRDTTSTRRCAGPWSSGWPSSAPSTPTRSRPSGAATGPWSAISAPPPRWPPDRPPRPRPRRGRR